MDFNFYRIGSIIMKKLDERPVVLNKFEQTNANIEGIYIDNGLKADFYKNMVRGVPINENRLERLHFTKVDKCWVYNNCWVRLLENNAVVEFGRTRDTIRFIHELQNLYRHEKKEELHLPFRKLKKT